MEGIEAEEIARKAMYVLSEWEEKEEGGRIEGRIEGRRESGED
jgi:hypothetical protein